MLDVGADRPGTDPQSGCDLPVGAASGEEAKHLDLARSQAGDLDPTSRPPMPSGRQHRVDGCPVEPPGRRLGLQVVGSVRERHGRPVRSSRAHGLIAPGRSEHAGLGRDRVDPQAVRVARAVQALVHHGRNRTDRRQQWLPGEDPSGQVGHVANPFDLRHGERTGLVPDRGGDSDRPEPVHEPGPADDRDRLLVQSQGAGCFRGEVGYRTRVPGPPRRLQIGVVGEDSEHIGERHVRDQPIDHGDRATTASQGSATSTTPKTSSAWSLIRSTSAGSNSVRLRSRTMATAAADPPCR